MNWTITILNQDMDWFRVLGDDDDYLEQCKRDALNNGYEYYVEIEDDEKSTKDEP